LPDLVILNGSRAGAVFTLPEIPAVLGRSPEAHLQVEDPWISSMHAMFERRGEAVWVIDLESRNGTFVGDERITEARLATGMVLRFGRTEVRVTETSRVAEPVDEEPAPERARADSPTEPRSRPEPQRATIRADAADPALHPPRVEVEDPTALVARPAALLRLSLHATGQGRPPDTLAIRAALDAAARAATNEGAVATRLAGAGVLALFGAAGASGEDTARALRAARTARSAVRAFGAGLDLRAAVDRGPVLAGNLAGPDAQDLAALGEAAERVERVLALCGPGEILAGPGAAGAAGLGPGMVLRIGREEILVFRDETR
jgi:pSer/pThr/pTyr-binding forkhead associated (FHA) protein